MAAEPTDARLVDDGLLAITWSDGRTLHYPVDHLRANCPCAHCSPGVEAPKRQREEFAGVRLKSLEQLGSYAFRIAFDDGHDLGIYTWPRLLALGYPEGQAPPPPAAPDPFSV
jgi:DUF971 family protein